MATWGISARMALQYMRARLLRTALTTLAIVFGVALVFAINLVMPSVLEAYSQSLDAETSGIDLTIANRTGAAFAPEEVIPTVEDVEGVAAVAGILRRNALLPDEGDFVAGEVEIYGLEPETFSAVRAFDLIDGRFLAAGDRGVLVVAQGVAEVGDTLSLVTAAGVQSYEVVGVVDETANLDRPRMYMVLSDAQSALTLPGYINFMEVRYADGANAERVTGRIEAALGENFITNPEPEDLAIMQIGYTMLNVLAGLALFMGGFLIFNTFRTVVAERRFDLGMLRAIGASRRQITQMLLVEGLLQGILGTLIGMVFGFLMALALVEAFSSLEGFTSARQIDLSLRPDAVLIAVIMGLLTTLLASYWPARRAGQTSPLEALRPQSVSAAQRTARWGLVVGIGLMLLSLLMLAASNQSAPGGAILFMVGMVIAAPGLVLPVARLFNPILTLWFAREGDIARGNLTRQPGRAAITASTLMIGLATLILITAIVSGFNALVQDLVDSTFSSDVSVLPPAIGVYGNVVAADPALAESIRALPDVETVSEWRYAASSLDNQRLEIIGLDPVTYPQVAALVFTEGDEDTIRQLGEGRSLIVSSLGAATLGLEVGDTFNLPTAQGEQPYTVIGIGDDILNFKLSAFYISHENMAADFNVTGSVMLMIGLQPGADTDAALTNIQQATAAYPQFNVERTANYHDELMSLVASGMGAYYILAFLILIPAGLGLLNTLSINILERTREIGLTRAVGATRGQVQKLVVAEAFLLGIFGAATGVLAGIAMSYGFVLAFSSIGWEVPYIFPFAGIIAAVVVAVLLAMFASVIPARRAAQLDIIRALQYQ